MLDDNLKERIRGAYKRLVEEQSLLPRWGQRVMIAEIAKTLARIGQASPEGEPHCVIEAGTGTGKTIAYAVAAIPMAQHLQKKLIVATATVALQEQFVFKDLPDIRAHSGLEFSYALAKGRRRYVCLSKLDKILQDAGGGVPMPLYPDEVTAPSEAESVPVYRDMLSELAAGRWDGDRDNWDRELPENVWFGVTTDHAQCTGRRCANISQCAFFKARDNLNDADVIVTNHDLVLSDLGLGGGAILPAPEDSIYVIDEGHHLPDKALNHFSAFCRLGTTLAWLEDIHSQWSDCATRLHEESELLRQLEQLGPLVEDVVHRLQLVLTLVEELVDQAEPTAFPSDYHRFPLGLVPVELQELASGLAARFADFSQRLQRLCTLFEDYLEADVLIAERTDLEAWYSAFGAMQTRAQGNLDLWTEFAVSGEDDNPPKARWITVLENAQGIRGYELRCSPILAAATLEEHLWSRASGSVVTSATLTALNSFDRFIVRSGIPESSVFKVVPSPFHYERAVFSVPAMRSDGGDPDNHTAELGELIPQLLEIDAGTLVLFSSRRQLQAVYELLPSDVKTITLVQGEYSKQETLRRHRQALDEGRGSVIFGLASYAEGVDLPGRYCTHVMIAKLPFAVPDHPVDATLGEWIESQGKNSFMEISVPDAALKIVQASGRLLRTEDDTGRVTLLDRRVVTRRYGRAILDSLPPYRKELA